MTAATWRGKVNTTVGISLRTMAGFFCGVETQVPHFALIANFFHFQRQLVNLSFFFEGFGCEN